LTGSNVSGSSSSTLFQISQTTNQTRSRADPTPRRPGWRVSRDRYLALLLDAVRAHGNDLPGPPPGGREIAERWET
jgi:hypothetical protein